MNESISVILQSGSSLIKWQKLLSPNIDLGRMCIALRMNLFWFGTTTTFGEIAKLPPLPVSSRHLGYSADDSVTRCRSRSNTCG